MKVFDNRLDTAKEIFSYNPSNHFYTRDIKAGLTLSKIKTPEYYYVQIQLSDTLEQKVFFCKEFSEKYHSAESFFFC